MALNATFWSGDPRMADYTPVAAVNSGDVVVLGGVPMVAHVDIAAAGLGALSTEGGIYKMAADGAIPVGTYVFWNSSTKKVSITQVAGQTTPFGWLLSGPTFNMVDAAPATSGDLALVLHDPVPPSMSGTGAPKINTAITTAGAGTLTAAALVGGVITRTGPTAAFTDTTDTAALIIAAMPNAVIGQSWEITIKNTVAFTDTLAGGTGVTLSGMTVIPPISWGRFLATYSAAGAVTLVGLETGALSTLPNSQYTTAALSTTTAAAGQLTGAANVFMNNSGATPGTYTTRTAAQMFADTPNAQVGQTYTLFLCNGQGTGTLTLAGGTGVTITGTATMATNVGRIYQVTFNTSSTMTFQNVGSFTAP